MDKTQELISSYAASLSTSDLTPEAIHAVKRSLIDSVGCALGAFAVEPAKIARRLASRVSSTSPASVLGTRMKTSPEMAAFANGTMIRYLDFNAFALWEIQTFMLPGFGIARTFSAPMPAVRFPALWM